MIRHKMKLSEAWRTCSNDHRKWVSDRAYHPAALGCPNPQILESMLQTLGKIVLDNSVNRELAVLCSECDDLDTMSAGPNGERIRAFHDRLLTHTEGDFIKKFEAHLTPLSQAFESYYRATHTTVPEVLYDLAEKTETMKPTPPSYLPNFYIACLCLLWPSRDWLYAIDRLRREGII